MSAGESVLSYDADARPHLMHERGRAPELCEAMEKILAEAKIGPAANVFFFAGTLVEVIAQTLPSKEGIARPAGALILLPLTIPRLQEIIGWTATHWRTNAKGESHRIDCPRSLAEMFMARGQWPKIRVLTGISECPIMATDCHVIDEPGYHQATGLFLSFCRTGYLPPPVRPTREEGAAAARRVQSVVEDFAFCDDSDRSSFVAAAMTAVNRRLLPAAPIPAITAPTPGTGKSMVAETFAHIATGRSGAVMSFGRDEAENEKRLTGALFANDPIILIDNCEAPVKNVVACQAATQPQINARALGASTMRTVPTNCFICFNGNNLSIVGDLNRRVLWIRLDAGVERPEQRQFTHNHLERVRRLRGSLLRDLLTITLAYAAAGSPPIPGLQPFGGFEQWDKMVRRPLVWLGLADPLLASEGFRDQDPDMESTRAVFSAWHSVFLDRPATAKEVVEAGEGNASISDALLSVRRTKDQTTVQALGYWLRSRRDKVVDGMVLRHAGVYGAAKLTLWSVTGVDASSERVPTGRPF